MKQVLSFEVNYRYIADMILLSVDVWHNDHNFTEIIL